MNAASLPVRAGTGPIQKRKFLAGCPDFPRPAAMRGKMPRNRSIIVCLLLALPMHVLAQGENSGSKPPQPTRHPQLKAAKFVLILQQPVEGKPVSAELVCAANISLPECEREAAKSVFEVNPATPLPVNQTVPFVAAPGNRPARANSTLEFAPGITLKSGDTVRLTYGTPSYSVESRVASDLTAGGRTPDASSTPGGKQRASAASPVTTAANARQSSPPERLLLAFAPAASGPMPGTADAAKPAPPIVPPASPAAKPALGNVDTPPDAAPAAPAEMVRPTALPAPPDIVVQATEGSTVITGYYTSANPPKGVTAEVRSSDSGSGDIIEVVADTAVGTGGKFTVNLTHPLTIDEVVNLYGVTDGVMGNDAKVVRVTSSSFDWGRVQAYFTFGMVLGSNETAATTSSSGQSTASPFSTTSASPYIAFDVDDDWLVNRWKHTLSANTFFNARLTQIGTTALSSATNVSALLSSKQAASLQGGAYLPFTLTRWDFHSHYYSLYVAPLVKGGFYTVNDNPTAGITPVNSTSFYKFFGSGMRIGNYREYRYWDGTPREGRAPRQLSYMDIMIGRWGNFESVDPLSPGSTGCQTSVSADCYLRARPWRVGFEGFLQVPNSPFILGMSANIAALHARSALAPGFIAPPDDLRFMIGMRFDGKTLLAPLTKLGSATSSAQ